MSGELKTCYGLATALLVTGNPILGAGVLALAIGWHRAERKQQRHD